MRTTLARVGLAEAITVLVLFSLAVLFFLRSPPTLSLRSYSFRIEPAIEEVDSLAVGEERKVTFAVVNDRDEPLRLLPGVCPCAAQFVAHDELHIPPFGRGEIEVRVKRLDPNSPAHVKRIELATDDPEHPRVKLLVRIPAHSSGGRAR